MNRHTLPAFRAIARISSLLLLGTAQAHHVWIEQDGKEVKHADGAGERGAEKYARASYVTSLTMMQSEGLAALPASPAVTPNKMN